MLLCCCVGVWLRCMCLIFVFCVSRFGGLGVACVCARFCVCWCFCVFGFLCIGVDVFVCLFVCGRLCLLC